MNRCVRRTAQDMQVGFGYNAVGQITSRNQSNDAAYTWTPGTTNTTTGYTYDGRNRLTAIGAGGVGSDARGNLISGLPGNTSCQR
jgi:hypothetical protein